MKKVEKNIIDIKSIRLLFIFDFAGALIIFISFFNLENLKVPLITTCLFLPILLASISLQLFLYFIPKGKIIFDESGVAIITKNTNTHICWDNIECIYYNSFSDIFPLLNHFTIELWFKLDNKIIDFDKDYGNIIIFKNEFLNIISFIPRHILDENDFMIYRNVKEKQKNEYNL